MSKVLAVAKSEYANAVRSKAFLAGVFLMPVLMFGGILVMSTVKDQVDLRDRRFTVVDRSGRLWEALEAAARQRDEEEAFALDESGGRKQVQPRFLPELYRPAEGTNGGDGNGGHVELELSDRVRSGDVFAFLVIDPGVITQVEGEPAAISYYTETPTFQDLQAVQGFVTYGYAGDNPQDPQLALAPDASWDGEDVLADLRVSQAVLEFVQGN